MGITAGDDILASHFKGTRYYTIHPSDFFKDWEYIAPEISANFVRSSSDTAPVKVHAPIHLPNGATITSLKLYWFRNDAAASGQAKLLRLRLVDTNVYELAAANSDSSAGHHEVEDTTINEPIVDNTNYAYFLELLIAPNDAKGDVYAKGAVITYSVDYPLP